jgi:FtsP/CotA-like multicopper oxidase with cupredoxin domain
MAPSRLLPIALLVALFTLPAGAVATHKPGHGGGGNTPPLTIASKPGLIVFGGSSTISGRLNGTGQDGGQPVELQANPFPYTAGFRSAGTATSASNGNYSFVVKPGVRTRYRVRAQGLTSAVRVVEVRLRVGLSLSDSTPRRAQIVSFSGRARPDHDGRTVQIQRRTSTGYVTVRTTTTTDVPGAAYSAYSRSMRVYRDGTYRVVVLSGDQDHRAGISRRRLIDVH